MAPEVIKLLDGNQGGSPSNAVRWPKYPFKLDTYSYGLVCYEILSGRLPFWECGNPIEVKRRILNKERPLLPCKPSDCPLMLKALIEKCWSHEPEERPAFCVICRELKYIKYLLMTGGLMKFGVDSKITEVRSRSLPKSFTDETAANYQTPSNYQTSANYQATPNDSTLSSNSSIDSSPGSSPWFRRSSNNSGRSSSRGADTVENSRLYYGGGGEGGGEENKVKDNEPKAPAVPGYDYRGFPPMTNVDPQDYDYRGFPPMTNVVPQDYDYRGFPPMTNVVPQGYDGLTRYYPVYYSTPNDYQPKPNYYSDYRPSQSYAARMTTPPLPSPNNPVLR